MKIKADLFDLTEEQLKIAKLIYGKPIKCLVAPYHNYAELKDLVNDKIFLFPERDMSLIDIKRFINNIIASDIEEPLIITKSQNIILDMINSSVRVLNENGKVVACMEQTLAANIHTLKVKVLDNSSFQKENTDVKLQFYEKFVKKLIKKTNKIVQDGTAIERKEWNEIKKKINLIGEDVIKHVINNRFNNIEVKKRTDINSNETLAKIIRKNSLTYKDPVKYKKTINKLIKLYRQMGHSDAKIKKLLKV